LSRVLALGGHARLTTALLALLWAAGLATGSVMHGPSPRILHAVGVGVGGHLWSPLTSALWCANLPSYLFTTVLLIALCGPAERRLGTRRVAVVLLVAQLAGTTVGLAAIAMASRLSEPWSRQLAGDLAVGLSPAAVAVALAWSCALPALWRRRIRLVLLVGIGMLALYSGSLLDVLRLTVGLAGFAVGPLLLPRSPRRLPVLPSNSEARLLVALVVAATAVGPLVAVISGTAIGPLSALRCLLLSPPPGLVTVREICADPARAEDCASLQSQLRLSGIGPAVMSVVPTLLVLVAAEGLRRGRHFAWWASVLLNGVLAGLGGVLAVEAVTEPRDHLVALEHVTDDRYLILALLAFAQPLAMVGVLVAVRRQFALPAPRRAYRRLATLTAAAVAVVSVSYVGGGYLLRAQFDRPPTFRALLADLPLRLLPPGYLDGPDTRLTPMHPMARVLYQWAGPVFWLAVITACAMMVVGARAHHSDTEPGRIRALLEAGSGSALSYMSTWQGNSYWYSTGDAAAIAYRVVGRVALTMGDPIGPQYTHRDALRGFAAFCASHGWAPCLYSITAPTGELAGQLGWHTVQIAQEASVPLRGLTFTGRKWQDVRTALNNAAKRGITAQWLSYREAPQAIADQVRAISAEWVAGKGAPEMRFTLGGLDELADREVRCLIAVGPGCRVQGVTSWLPVYRDGVLVGWTLDLMRHRGDAFHGVGEFLIASAIRQFQDEGFEFLSLSGVPLARADRGGPAPGHASRLQRLLDGLGRALEPIYGFRSLLAFKAKFQPTYRPLFMAYLDPVALPTIATSIGRAYLPHLTVREGSRLVGRLLKRPAQGTSRATAGRR
jgi:lysylphosphatidylglycerol synthetase-like protein (DUF2156 family)